MTKTTHVHDSNCNHHHHDSAKHESSEDVKGLKKPRIGFRHEAPEWLHDMYLQRGYRLYYRTIIDTARSLLQLHNETLNIWTALLPLFTFIYLSFRIAYVWDVTFAEKAVNLVFTSCACLSFMASTTYHWFGCMGRDCRSKLLCFDIGMIAFLIGGSYYPPLYYSFYCHQHLAIFYLSVISVLCMACVVLFLVPKFSGDDYRGFRVGIFAATTAFGFCPMFHIVSTYGGIAAIPAELQTGILFICGMYAGYSLGLLFYVSRFPEKFFPSTFDIWFHSHNFWHFFIFVATLVHYFGAISLTEMHKTATCYGMEKEFLTLQQN